MSDLPSSTSRVLGCSSSEVLLDFWSLAFLKRLWIVSTAIVHRTYMMTPTSQVDEFLAEIRSTSPNLPLVIGISGDLSPSQCPNRFRTVQERGRRSMMLSETACGLCPLPCFPSGPQLNRQLRFRPNCHKIANKQISIFRSSPSCAQM